MIIYPSIPLKVNYPGAALKDTPSDKVSSAYPIEVLNFEFWILNSKNGQIRELIKELKPVKQQERLKIDALGTRCYTILFFRDAVRHLG